MPMVYIKKFFEEGGKRTFLHFYTNKEGFALRDFSAPNAKEAPVVKRQMPPEWTAQRIRELASVTGSWLIKVTPEKPVADYDYWHKKPWS